MLKSVFVPVHRAGWPFITLFAVATVALWLLFEPLGVVGCILTLWCVYFFRDPDRVTPVRDGLIISPADGVVQMIDRAAPPPELEMGDNPLNRVAVFMNVFNVHVNRAPIGGTITGASYRPGKFLNASLDKGSEFNERQSLKVRTDDGTEVAFVQIAGLVARRILCDVRDGDTVRAGQRFGMIRFGSRVDIYMPDQVEPLVSVGQTAVAGETVIGDMRAQETARMGEIR